jgi:hypothetical protein
MPEVAQNAGIFSDPLAYLRQPLCREPRSPGVLRALAALAASAAFPAQVEPGIIFG